MIEHANGSKETIMLSKSEFFGEKSLSQPSMSAATMVADSPVTMLTISKEALQQILGPLLVYSVQVCLPISPRFCRSLVTCARNAY